jgi:2,4-dienoyl-CoA reductase-like NADH-dependent reductase (Old Yellow Enzyme family)
MPGSLLFAPLALRAVRLPNRVVISPMCQYSATDGLADDWHFAHLAKFAIGRAGLIFTEASAVEADGRITHGDLGMWRDEHVAPLQRITAFIRSQGSIPGIQLAHAGRKASMQRPWFGNGPLDANDARRGDVAWPIVGPGDNPLGPGWLTPHALMKAEMQRIRESFVAAAARADRAGFDVAEIHGAHGYLLHSFLSPLTNPRTDEYGGSLANRMRLPLEVVAEVRARWPAAKPLFVRVSAVDDIEGGWSIDDSIVLATELKRLGVDVVDCSSGGALGSATAAAKPLTPRVPGFQVPFAQAIRSRADIATMAVGLILDAHQAEAALQSGQADLIAVGREALNDPNWALHAARALGEDPRFEMWPEQYGWWLTRRQPLLDRERGG